MSEAEEHANLSEDVLGRWWLITRLEWSQWIDTLSKHQLAESSQRRFKAIGVITFQVIKKKVILHRDSHRWTPTHFIWKIHNENYHLAISNSRLLLNECAIEGRTVFWEKEMHAWVAQVSCVMQRTSNYRCDFFAWNKHRKRLLQEFHLNHEQLQILMNIQRTDAFQETSILLKIHFYNSVNLRRSSIYRCLT